MEDEAMEQAAPAPEEAEVADDAAAEDTSAEAPEAPAEEDGEDKKDS